MIWYSIFMKTKYIEIIGVVENKLDIVETKTLRLLEDILGLEENKYKDNPEPSYYIEVS